MKDRHNMNNVMRAALALALFVGATAKSYAEPYKIPAVVEIDTDSTLDGDTDIKNTLYFNLSFKVNDRYTVTPEMANLIHYRQDGVNSTSVEHYYTRVTVTDKQLAKLGDWTLDMGYRYYLPTTTGQQKAGTFGSFEFRPGLKQAFGPFTAYVRYNVSLGLQRNGYALHDDGVKAQNKLIGGTLQMLPSFALMENLSLDAEIDLVQRYMGPVANGGGGKRFFNDFYHWYALNYTIKSLDDLAVGIYIEQDVKDFTSDMSLFDKAQTDAGIAIAKTF